MATKDSIEYWVIPPECDAKFTAHLENVLETYEKPYDPSHPVICMEEQPVQLIKETRVPIAATKDHGKRIDDARWNPNCQWNFERTIGDVDDASQIVSRVTSLTFSPDGKLLATGSGEPSRSGHLKLWRVEDGAFVNEVVNPDTDMILGLDFLPQGDRLVSASADRFVKVFLVANGLLVRAFEGHTHQVLGVAWKFDGQLIASGGADHAIKIWDPETGEQKRTIATHKKEVTSISFVGASDEILTSSADNEVRLHRTANGGDVRSFAGATDFMFSAAASDDGKAIVAGGQDGVLRVWEGTKSDPRYQFNSEK